MMHYAPGLRLGILGGGQLGKMLVQEALPYHLQTVVMDPDPEAPAAMAAAHFEAGDFTDFNTVYRFGRRVDALTYEIEKVNAFALMELKSDGLAVFPDPTVLRTVQDKIRQKRFYQKHGIPTVPFRTFNDREALLSADLTFPCVIKAARGGYDGRGVVVAADRSDLEGIFDGPYLVEDFVHVKAELSVVMARGGDGETAVYPPVMMFFLPEANLLDVLVAPALLPEKKLREAKEIARTLAEAFDLIGVMAVELLIDAHNRLWVNETAPRPHNSGHHTMKAHSVSQFEQHLRAGLGLPLGDVSAGRPAAMFNLLGAADSEGPARYEGLSEALGERDVQVYLYGKAISKPYRKMGHVTVLAETPAAALQRARALKRKIRVYGGP